ncbi:MAG: ThiF family adenylyltransferase [Campylobacterota bacterium]|nr:ThiF family adenylyltransferase [Campylobacterota bacterium]
MDKEIYFKRQIELLGEDVQNSLGLKKILIVGCGGLGCSVAIALGSSGIGNIDLIDFDEVSVHNIHRQIAFNISDIGKNKSVVLKEFLLKRSEFTNINSYSISLSEFNYKNNYDLIIDATDNLETRVLIDKIAKKNDTPWIYGTVEAFHGQVCFFENNCFEDIFKISEHKIKGIAAPMVMQIASLEANLAIRYLSSLSIKKDYLYYCFFDNYGEYNIQKFALPK